MTCITNKDRFCLPNQSKIMRNNEFKLGSDAFDKDNFDVFRSSELPSLLNRHLMELNIFIYG